MYRKHTLFHMCDFNFAINRRKSTHIFIEKKNVCWKLFGWETDRNVKKPFVSLKFVDFSGCVVFNAYVFVCDIQIRFFFFWFSCFFRFVCICWRSASVFFNFVVGSSRREMFIFTFGRLFQSDYGLRMNILLFWPTSLTSFSYDFFRFLRVTLFLTQPRKMCIQLNKKMHNEWIPGNNELGQANGCEIFPIQPSTI